jgi:hypothetical protein
MHILEHLKNFSGPLSVNGEYFENVVEALQKLDSFDGELEIILNDTKNITKSKIEEKAEKEVSSYDEEYVIKVRQYMTKKATPQFDFMKKFNDNNPMPMRVMKGVKIEETRGMVKMKLNGFFAPSEICFRCGRTLTHEVSRMYGIGPECGGHYHIANPTSLEAFRECEKEIRAKIEAVEWTGWIIKSAIEEEKILSRA